MKSLNARLFTISGFTVFFALILVGCGGGGYASGGGYGAPPSLTGITISPTTPTIINGTTARMTAIGNYSNGSSADITASVTWTSATPTTASVVSSSGVVTGNAVGTATITAVMNNGTLYGVISANEIVTVTGATLTGIAIAPLTMSVAKGTFTHFTASGSFSDATTGNISGSVIWSSGDTTVATINANGLATGVGMGNSIISAALGAISNAATLTVF